MAATTPPTDAQNPEPDRVIEMTVFPTTRAAINHASATGGRAVRMAGTYAVLASEDAEWLASTGAVFLYLWDEGGQIGGTAVNR